jgi:D-lactate dehydrogenase
MNIGFFELENWEKEYFQKEMKDANLLFSDTPLRDDSPSLDKLEIIVIFIHSQITKEILDKMPNLKFITTMSTGFDHIDIAECKARNISVSNVPTYGESTVAEHTFALLLAISRRIIESVDKTKRGEFMPNGLTGFELKGKTLGVIGVGSIGTNVIKIAKGFGMNVIAFKRTPDYVLEKQFGFKFVDMKTLYQQSDIITLHLPYSKETHHIVNEGAFSMMKKGVVIINTARGGLMDSTALLNSLHDEKVSYAGLDVLEEEPLLQEERDILSKTFDKEKLVSVLQDHMLVNNPHVIVTPHNAFNSNEALHAILQTTHENLVAFLNNAPANTVSA